MTMTAKNERMTTGQAVVSREDGQIRLVVVSWLGGFPNEKPV